MIAVLSRDSLAIFMELNQSEYKKTAAFEVLPSDTPFVTFLSASSSLRKTSNAIFNLESRLLLN